MRYVSRMRGWTAKARDSISQKLSLQPSTRAQNGRSHMLAFAPRRSIDDRLDYAAYDNVARREELYYFYLAMLPHV